MVGDLSIGSVGESMSEVVFDKSNDGDNGDNDVTPDTLIESDNRAGSAHGYDTQWRLN